MAKTETPRIGNFKLTSRTDVPDFRDYSYRPALINLKSSWPVPRKLKIPEVVIELRVDILKYEQRLEESELILIEAQRLKIVDDLVETRDEHHRPTLGQAIENQLEGRA